MTDVLSGDQRRQGDTRLACGGLAWDGNLHQGMSLGGDTHDEPPQLDRGRMAVRNPECSRHATKADEGRRDHRLLAASPTSTGASGAVRTGMSISDERSAACGRHTPLISINTRPSLIRTPPAQPIHGCGKHPVHSGPLHPHSGEDDHDCHDDPDVHYGRGDGVAWPPRVCTRPK